MKVKAVLIAEKPSLERIIKEVYYKHKNEIPYDIEFCTFAGHVCRLAPPNIYPGFDGYWDIDRLPIIPNWDYYKIQIAEDKKDIIANINKKIRESRPSIIINACDPDREGEHIFNLFKITNLQNFKGEIKRFWCNDLTEKEVLKNLINLLDEKEKENLREAAFCRAKSDWLVGMNLTEAATVTFSKGTKSIIKIGRVKTATLNMCYNRELAIQNFTPSSKYQIKTEYKDGFTGILFNEQENIEFETEQKANEYMKKINNKKHKIINIEKKNTQTKCPQLYKLSDLQIEAGKRYGYSASKVLELVQSLYEKKYMSYPRTDLRYISQEAAKDAPILIKNMGEIFPELKEYTDKVLKLDIVNLLKKNNKICNDKEVSKAGHTALITTTQKPKLETLSNDEINILKMVSIRLLSFLLEPLKEKRVEIITESNGNTFKSTYKTLIEPGFTILFSNKGNYLNIPDLKVGQEIDVIKLYTHEVKAVCPSRFTQADLIQLMENPIKYLQSQTEDNKTTLRNVHGIGTPATRAEIINALFRDGYCEEFKSGKNKVIKVTDFGMQVMNILNKMSFAQVDLTARWEEQLKRVEDGSMSSYQYRRAIEEYIVNNIQSIKAIQSESISNIKKSKCKCPCCGEDILIGKKYYRCSKYNGKEDGCNFVLPLTLLNCRITENDLYELIKGKNIEKKLKKDDKEWKQQIKLNGTKMEFVKNPIKSLGPCPCCQNDIVKRPWGYGCSNYTNGCKFSINKIILGKTLTDKNIHTLLNDGTTGVLKGFTNKDGKTFDARLILDDNEKKIKFSFD